MIRDYRDRSPASRDGGTLVEDIMEAHDRDPSLVAANDLVAALTGPYVAGLDTVANTLASLVYAVLKHPAVLERVRAEADALFARGALTDEAISDLPSINGAVLETLRLYPIAVAQPRVANRDFEYAGYPIREGEPVYCAVTHAGADEALPGQGQRGASPANGDGGRQRGNAMIESYWSLA